MHVSKEPVPVPVTLMSSLPHLPLDLFIMQSEIP